MSEKNILVVVEGKDDLYFWLTYLKKLFPNFQNESSKIFPIPMRSGKMPKNEKNLLILSNINLHFLEGNSKEKILLSDSTKILENSYRKAIKQNFNKIFIFTDPDSQNENDFKKSTQGLLAKLKPIKEESKNTQTEIKFASWNFKIKGNSKTLSLENLVIVLLRKLSAQDSPELIEKFLEGINGKEILPKKLAKVTAKTEPNICRILLKENSLHNFYKKIVETTDSKFLKETVSDKFGVGQIFEFLNDENTQEK